MLNQTLHDLERDGLVTRIRYLEVALRVDYRQTDLGRSLSNHKRAMEQWVKMH